MERVKNLARWMIRQRWWWPLVSLLILALLFNRAPVRADFRASHYLKANRALAVGATADFDDFELHSGILPGPSGLFVDDQSLDRLAHSRYRRSLAAGDLLRWEDLETEAPVASRSSREIPPGHRAYVILPENPWLARSGDRVDILLRPNRRAEEPLVLAENVLVLERLGKGTKGEVVVALRQRDLELLEKAKQQGKLSIAVLGKSDFSGPRSLSSRKNRRHHRRINQVEIITGAE